MGIFSQEIFSFNPCAFGLDLSDLSLKIAQLKKEGKNLALASYTRAEIPEGVIDQGEIKKEEVLIQIIKKAILEVKGLPLKTKYCVVSLPETEAFIRVVQLPKMKKEEIAEAIKWEAEAHIPLSIDEVYLDWQIIQPLKNNQDHYDILIGVLSKKLIDPYLETLKKAGLKPLVFEIESIATARALIKNDFSPKPIMIIDLGARRSSFIIFSGRTVHFTASLPISNNYLIEEIARKLKIDKTQAKRLKFEVGLDKDKEEGRVFEALLPSLTELVNQIKKYIEFFHTHSLAGHFKNGEVSKILLCGGGANLTGLSSFLSKELKTLVEIGNPWINILKSPPEKIPELPYQQSIAYTTALGLALRGINLTNI